MLFLEGVAVAMNLSKIYRGVETAGISDFQFRSFGETQPDQPSDSSGFVKSSGVAAPLVTLTPAPSNQATEEAYARGRKDGLDNAEKQLETTAQALAAAAEELSRLRESLARNSHQDMLRLVLAISEQIIRREVAADPKVILTIIETALQASIRTDQYRILINPVDLENVTRQKPLFLASISGLKNLSIETDPAISPGGCRIDSELGAVDATIETQLEAIQQALNEAITDIE